MPISPNHPRLRETEHIPTLEDVLVSSLTKEIDKEIINNIFNNMQQEAINYFKELDIVTNDTIPIEKASSAMMVMSLEFEYPDSWGKYLEFYQGLESALLKEEKVIPELNIVLKSNIMSIKYGDFNNATDFVNDVIYYMYYEMVKLSEKNIDVIPFSDWTKTDESSNTNIIKSIMYSKYKIQHYTRSGTANMLLMNIDTFNILMKEEAINKTFIKYNMESKLDAKIYKMGTLLDCDCYIGADDLITSDEIIIGSRTTKDKTTQGIYLFIVDEIMDNRFAYYMKSVGGQKEYFYRRIVFDN